MFIDLTDALKDMVANNVLTRRIVGGALAATEGLDVAAKAPPAQAISDQ